MLKRPVPGKKQWVAMLVLSAGLSSGLGYAAWAAQPARSAASAQAEVYATFVQARADGESRQFELREAMGAPFSFSMISGKGVVWSVELTVKPADGGLLLLSGAVKADGVLVSSPSLLTGPGKPAGIEVSTRDGHSLLAMEVRSQLEGVESTSSGKISVEPQAQAGQPLVDRMTPPVYPKDAFDKALSGAVMLRVEVGADGRATDVTVISSQPQGVFEAAAIAAAKQWTFTPAMKDGKAVAGAVKVPIWFDLDENVTHTEAGTGS